MHWRPKRHKESNPKGRYGLAIAVIGTLVLGCGGQTRDEGTSQSSNVPAAKPAPTSAAECESRTTEVRVIGLAFIGTEMKTVRLAYRGSSSSPPCSVDLSGSDPHVTAANPQFKNFDERTWCAETAADPDAEELPEPFLPAGQLRTVVKRTFASGREAGVGQRCVVVHRSDG